MSQTIPTKRQYQPITETDGLYVRTSQPIKDSETLSHSRPLMVDFDTLCPPKKRALFDYNREQARKIQSTEFGGNQFPLDENYNKKSKNSFYSNIDIKRQNFCSAKSKLDSLSQETEIRPRSDSLHSLNSQCSEVSSVESVNLASRETSPVSIEDNEKYENPYRNTLNVINGVTRLGSNDYKMNSRKNTDIYIAERNSVQEHETPERNPILGQADGFKPDIQKPLFTPDSRKFGSVEKSKPLISKTLFPVTLTNADNLEKSEKWNKHYKLNTNIPNEGRPPFQYSSIPVNENSQNEQGSNSDTEKMTSDSFNSGDKITKSLKKSDSENSNEGLKRSRNSKLETVDVNDTKYKKQINQELMKSPKSNFGKVLGDVTNSLNVQVKCTDNGSISGNITNTRDNERQLTEQNANIQQESYKCQLCNKEFKQGGHFQNHMISHQESDNIFKCVICNIEFHNKDLYQAHVRMAHTGSEPYKCEICNREFSQFNNLRRHMRVHRDKTYKCHLCDRVFNEEFYLKMHVGTHTGERVYNCGVCSAQFSSNHELKTHVKSHSPSELHNCNICGKSFSKACVLRQHRKTHSGERPHKCDVCLKTFIHRHHLTMHMRSHQENKPFTCSFCSKVFSQTSHLYKHLRQHEDENIENKQNVSENDLRTASENKTHKSKSYKHDKQLKPGKAEYEQNQKNYDQVLRESNKENIEHRCSDQVKVNSDSLKNESRSLKDNIHMVNNYPDKILSKSQVQNMSDGLAGVNVSQKDNLSESLIENPDNIRRFNGTNINKNDPVSTKRFLEFSSSDLVKRYPKKMKDEKETKARKETKATKEWTETNLQAESDTETNLNHQRLHMPTVSQTLGNVLELPMSSAASAKLPSFSCITSGLKESQPNRPLTGPYMSIPYHQHPSYQNHFYTYSYPSMSYDSPMYLAYSAQMQAYHNMLYYKSKVSVENQYRFRGQALQNTSVLNHQDSANEKREAESLQKEHSQKRRESMNLELNIFNGHWYRKPEIQSSMDVSNSDTNKAEKENIENVGSKNANNTLLIAALTAKVSSDTYPTNKNYTSEHIMQKTNQRDQYLDKSSECDVDKTGLVETNHFQRESQHASINPEHTYLTAVNKEEERQNIPNAEQTDSRRENVNVSQSEHCERENQVNVMNDNHFTDQNEASENLMVSQSDSDKEIDEESYKMDGCQTNSERVQSEYYVCCDTCNYTFSCKQDLKRHFIENPACFSKVCETSRISEEFGWQLLDCYLASLETNKSSETDQLSNKLEADENSSEDQPGRDLIECPTLDESCIDLSRKDFNKNHDLDVGNIGKPKEENPLDKGSVSYQRKTEFQRNPTLDECSVEIVMIGDNTNNSEEMSNIEDSGVNLILESQKMTDQSVLENDNHETCKRILSTHQHNHKQNKSNLYDNEDQMTTEGETAEAVYFEKLPTVSRKENGRKETEYEDATLKDAMQCSEDGVYDRDEFAKQCSFDAAEDLKQRGKNISDLNESDKSAMPKKETETGMAEKEMTGLDKGKEMNDYSEADSNLIQQFECPVCSGTFVSERALSLHVVNHTKDRPFACICCDRNFTQRHNLKRHMMSHSDRNVECPVCERSFKEDFYLKMHMKIHEMEHVTKCEICGERVAKINIGNHMKKHFGPIEENPTYNQIAERVREIMKENGEIAASEITTRSTEIMKDNDKTGSDNVMGMSDMSVNTCTYTKEYLKKLSSEHDDRK